MTTLRAISIDSDHYDSDDDIYETVNDPDKKIRYTSNRVEVVDARKNEQEIQERKIKRLQEHREFVSRDRLEHGIDEAYYDIIDYTKEMGLSIFDRCSLADFRDFMIQHIST